MLQVASDAMVRPGGNMLCRLSNTNLPARTSHDLCHNRVSRAVATRRFGTRWPLAAEQAAVVSAGCRWLEMLVWTIGCWKQRGCSCQTG
jgi:hypothetical protein